MAKHLKKITVELLDEDFTLTITELCEQCQVQEDFIKELMSYGLIEPLDKREAKLRFGSLALQRTQKALRLHHDLEINMPGIALILELLEELEILRRQL